MSAEAERILDSIDTSPGDELGADAPPDDPGLTDPGADALATLAGGDIVDQKSAALLVSLFLGQLRRIRHRECYRLDEEGLETVGGVWVSPINGVWRKFAPALLLRLNSSVPDLFKAILTTGFAFAPLVAADIAESRKEEDNKHRPRTVPARPAPAGPAGRVQASPGRIEEAPEPIPEVPRRSSGIQWGE